MALIELVPELQEDFDRILTHLEAHESPRLSTAVDAIIDAIDVLETNPLIGRPSENGKRELIIGPRGTGYVALYRYLEEIDLVVVLAIRSQREAGYAR